MIRLILRYIKESIMYSYKEVKDFLKEIPIINALALIIFAFTLYLIVWAIPLILDYLFGGWILGILLDVIFVIFIMCSIDRFISIWDNKTDRDDYKEYIKKKNKKK